jgi:hypothetical protein
LPKEDPKSITAISQRHNLNAYKYEGQRFHYSSKKIGSSILLSNAHSDNFPVTVSKASIMVSKLFAHVGLLIGKNAIRQREVVVRTLTKANQQVHATSQEQSQG